MTAVIPKISKLSQNVIRVLGCNPGYFTLQGTNTYILGTGRNRILVDCGESDIPEYLENLKNVVKENNISLTKIILTHWHPDHVGGTEDILREIARQDCKVYKYQNLEHDMGITKGNFQLTYLANEDEISVEGASLKAFHTPGHTKDHLVLFLKEEESLFSGDCILGEGSAVFEDLINYLNSLRKISSLKPNKVYPGHGPVVSNPQQKINEYIENRMNRENQILNILTESKDKFITVVDIVQIIYPKLPEALVFGAKWNVQHHLDKLLQENRIEKKEDNNSVVMFRLKLNSNN